MPFRTLSRISQEQSGAEQNPSVRNLVSPYRICQASFSFSGLDGAEITLFPWETLESVSSCTRFSGFLTISSFGFNRLSSKLVGMFFGIVPMFLLKDFVPNCFVAQICANYGAHAHFGAYLRDEPIPNKILLYEHWNYPKEHAYQFLAQTVKSEARYRRKT